jgi:hypothetical protein
VALPSSPARTTGSPLAGSVIDVSIDSALSNNGSNLIGAFVDICTEVLDVPRTTVLVEFTLHAGDEILRDGKWAGDWTDPEAREQAPAVVAALTIDRCDPASPRERIFSQKAPGFADPGSDFGFGLRVS